MQVCAVVTLEKLRLGLISVVYFGLNEGSFARKVEDGRRFLLIAVKCVYSFVISLCVGFKPGGSTVLFKLPSAVTGGTRY